MDVPSLHALLAKHRINGGVIDTNLLLLLVVGLYDVTRIQEWSRTLKYDVRDFHLLKRILDRLERRIVTPSIITETDNLSRLMREDEHEAVSGVLRGICTSYFEVYVPSAKAIIDPLHRRLGLTDCITLALSRERYLVITDDYPLANRIASEGGDVININHIRAMS